MHRTMTRARRTHRGTTLLLVSLMMMTIIAIAAMVIDINQGYLSTQRLRSAADMAAASAAVWLPDQTSASNSANSTAAQIAQINGATSQSITYPSAGSVRVSMQTTAYYFFAPIFGLRTKVVAASATATSRGGHIVPIGLRDTARTAGTTYNNFNFQDLSLGALSTTEWCALSIGGSGAANFTNRLENAYNGNYAKGAGIPTETSGGINAAADTGIRNDPITNLSIFEQAQLAPWNDTGATYTYPNFPEGDPRIVMVALVTRTGSTVTIHRFGSAYLQNYTTGGTGRLTFVWLGEFTATAGSPVRGWFATKGLTALSQ